MGWQGVKRDGLTVEPLGIHTQTRRRPTRRTPAPHARAVSSVVEHYNDTVGVTGSNPVPPTTFLHVHSIESGRSETVRDARNNVTTTVYNARNDVVSRVDALGNVTECFFDPVGGPTGVLHKNDPPFMFAYDAARVPPQTRFGVLWGGGLMAIGWFC
ncbi:MAG: hypothetical protein UZ18_ATM001002228, partial [Armatimonadetes bacterium OLB18]